MEDVQIYLQPTQFIDSDSPQVIEFAQSSLQGARTDIDQAIRLYYAVRDGIRYDPYHISFAPEALKASAVLARKTGFCVEKAILLAAGARAVGIASRLGFANVRNHLTTERLRRMIQTDVFVFHGYTELFLDNKWVKATPVFNLSLCQRFGVKPLEFDGRNDSLFHPFDSEGKRHMEYIYDHGQFADLPYGKMVSELKRHYPQLFGEEGAAINGSFEEEALEERGKA
ncbi:MAG: transglutaminase domain-containing protein [Acidobacteria bacterium]|nr:transglutaminase domain-containing protein [Acidobacteriota bacterium]